MEVPNNLSSSKFAYFSLNWTDSDTQIIFSDKYKNLIKTVKFIDSSLKKGDSVLVHSVKGQCRACSVIAAYFMDRYFWTLNKTLEFIRSCYPMIEIRQNFVKQLREFEETVKKKSFGTLSSKWTCKFYNPY